MTDESDSLPDHLADYFAGESTPEQEAGIEGWIEENPEHAALEQAVERVWHRIQWRPHPPVDVDAMLARVREAIGVSGTPQPMVFRRTVMPQGRRYGYMAVVGAVAILAIIVGVTRGRLGERRHAPVSMLRYVTPNGQRADITLPDGNSVALNVASELDVPADYVSGDRTVWLRGEALFAVRHRGASPFTVMAGGTRARVLGTAFLVRHYAADTSTIVAVRTGKIGVGPVVVTANRMIEVSRGDVVRLDAAAPSVFGFASGVLSFVDTPLPAALVELNRWYDADIRLGDSSLVVQRVNGKFAEGSLSNLAEILAWTFDVRVVRDGRVLTLYPRR